MKKYVVTVTFTEPLLGTVPKDPEVYRKHIQSKAADLGDQEAIEEMETIQSIEEKGWTGFHVLGGQPIIYDYVVRGFLKAACGSLRRVPGTGSSKLTAYKKIIDGLVFVEPRRIPLDLHGKEMEVLERPLRAQTAQGERIALARSDVCPVGTTMGFTLLVLGVVTEKQLREWLDYGAFQGFGQWRSGSYGRFAYEMDEA